MNSYAIQKEVVTSNHLSWDRWLLY